MRTRIVVTLLAWLTAVVVVALVAWFAINAAGRQVIADPGALRLAGEPIATRAEREVSDVPSSRPDLGQKSTSKSGAKSAPSHPPASPTSGSSEAAVARESAPASASGTYSTVAGRVRVRCDGSQITLAGGYAQPASGWSVKVLRDGPDQVGVRFDRRERRSLLLMADCADGRPEFDQIRFEGGSQDDRDRDDRDDDDGDRRESGR